MPNFPSGWAHICWLACKTTCAQFLGFMHMLDSGHGQLAVLYCANIHNALGGGNSLRPYSQQRPRAQTDFWSLCHMTDLMRIPENLCMLLPKALKTRAIKHTMALITDSIGCTKCAPAQMPWHLRHLNPALLNQQGMSTHPKMKNGSKLWQPWVLLLGCWSSRALCWFGHGISILRWPGSQC